MSTTTLTRDLPRPGRPFAPRHAWDHNAILAFAGLIWVGIAMGFGGDVVHHIRTHERPYPLIVHFHAAAFMGWLMLFTAQVLLIRTDRTATHRKLGFAMTGLAVVMLLIGPATAYVVQRLDFGTPRSDPAFLAIQLMDMIGFAPLIAAAVLLRKDAPAHKRLILLSTMYIADAGFARWLGEPLGGVLGQGPLGFHAGSYLGNDLLILGLGAYDLVTRGRLHPAYAVGLGWVLSTQALATTLYFTPAWKPVALALIGH
jgi:hypothetical protein